MPKTFSVTRRQPRTKFAASKLALRKALQQTVAGSALEKLNQPLATIARTIGASRMSVSRWIRGELFPSEANQIAIEETYGIDRRGWMYLAHSTPKPAARTPVAPVDNGDEPETLTMADALAADLAFADELEASGRSDVAAKLRANCRVDYAECLPAGIRNPPKTLKVARSMLVNHFVGR